MSTRPRGGGDIVGHDDSGFNSKRHCNGEIFTTVEMTTHDIVTLFYDVFWWLQTMMLETESKHMHRQIFFRLDQDFTKFWCSYYLFQQKKNTFYKFLRNKGYLNCKFLTLYMIVAGKTIFKFIYSLVYFVLHSLRNEAHLDSNHYAKCSYLISVQL